MPRIFLNRFASDNPDESTSGDSIKVELNNGAKAPLEAVHRHMIVFSKMLEKSPAQLYDLFRQCSDAEHEMHTRRRTADATKCDVLLSAAIMVPVDEEFRKIVLGNPCKPKATI